jgi:hypothetical protein
MIKTPKILQIAIISIAIMVAIFIGISLLFGRNREDIGKFLISKDAIKKFKAQSGKRQPGDDKISPLVQEAKKFALYLDPPPPPMPVQQSNNNYQNTLTPVNVRPVMPIVKFDLLATIVNTSKPEESRAMIDLPGSGQKFVKPGQQVGHTTIEEIKDGSIIVKAGERTEELAAKIAPLPSLVKDSPNHIFKMFPDLKTDGAHLSTEINTQSTSVATQSVTGSSRFLNSARRAVGNSPSAASVRPLPTSRLSTKRPAMPLTAQAAASSRTNPPRLSPEQEKKAMDELMNELSKQGNMGKEELEELKNAMNAENNASTNDKATPVENTEQQVAPNKPE